MAAHFVFKKALNSCVYFCTILVVTLLSSKMAHSSIDKGTKMLYILIIDKKEDTGQWLRRT